MKVSRIFKARQLPYPGDCRLPWSAARAEKERDEGHRAAPPPRGSSSKAPASYHRAAEHRGPSKDPARRRGGRRAPLLGPLSPPHGSHSLAGKPSSRRPERRAPGRRAAVSPLLTGPSGRAAAQCPEGSPRGCRRGPGGDTRGPARPGPTRPGATRPAAPAAPHLAGGQLRARRRFLPVAGETTGRREPNLLRQAEPEAAGACAEGGGGGGGRGAPQRRPAAVAERARWLPGRPGAGGEFLLSTVLPCWKLRWRVRRASLAAGKCRGAEAPSSTDQSAALTEERAKMRLKGWFFLNLPCVFAIRMEVVNFQVTLPLTFIHFLKGFPGKTGFGEILYFAFIFFCVTKGWLSGTGPRSHLWSFLIQTQW